MSQLRLVFLLLLYVCTFVSCTNKTNTKTKLFPEKISISGRNFIDQSGRHIILNGVNLVNKNKISNYRWDSDSLSFSNFKKWGINVVRLGVIWDGLEPEPGKFSESYLKYLDRQIEYATKAGVFVYLDMHQDLFSVKYSDGAPEWATLDEGKPHYEGEVWSDAYLISPAVQTAWDNFWDNKMVDNGMGIQDHYARVWEVLANRYKENSTVIGYDLMNEPFPGSEAQLYLPKLFLSYKQVFKEKTGKIINIEEVAKMWSSSSGRYKALELLNDQETFLKVMDGVYELHSAFEKNKLQPFYEKIAAQIRAIDKDKILFINHSYFCNSGVNTALKPLKINNQKDSLVAYAAHVYDLLVDTNNMENSSSDRLEGIFGNISKNGKRINLPVLIGEWGALHSDSNAMLKIAQTNINLINNYKFSNTYWAYYLGKENDMYFKEAIIHPYPYAISGELLSYNYDPNSHEFYCEWNELKDIKEPTIFYLPNINKTHVEFEGAYKIEFIENSNAGYLIINHLSSKKNTQRVIKIKWD